MTCKRCPVVESEISSYTQCSEHRLHLELNETYFIYFLSALLLLEFFLIVSVRFYRMDMSVAGEDTECGDPDGVSSSLQNFQDQDHHVPDRRPTVGRLEYFRHLERVETLRSYWELKHVQQVQVRLCLFIRVFLVTFMTN